MSRTVRDSKLETRAARDNLKPGPNIYWRTVVPKELHLGYRRRRKGRPGVWIVRHYMGLDASKVGRYSKATIGLADDYEDADGESVLSYKDAQGLALASRPGAPRGSPTVADAIENYVSWLRVHRSSGAAAGIQRRAELHVLPDLGAVRVGDLTTDQLNKWRDALAVSPALLRTGMGRATKNHKELPKTAEERRARKATANKSVTVLRAALNYAFNSGLIDDDKVWRRFKPFEKVDAARERSLSLEEAKRLINAADGGNSGFRDLVRAALMTGMRYGELCRLKVADYADGKVAVLRSKTGKPRHVRLTEEGRTFFSQLTAGRDPEATMLPRYGREWRKSEQYKPMRAACRGARIKPLGIHALRHTWASLSVMNGVPLIVVAHNLGHKDTRMVERHYGHLTKSYMDEAISAGAPRFGAVEASNVIAK